MVFIKYWINGKWLEHKALFHLLYLIHNQLANSKEAAVTYDNPCKEIKGWATVH